MCKGESFKKSQMPLFNEINPLWWFIPNGVSIEQREIKMTYWEQLKHTKNYCVKHLHASTGVFGTVGTEKASTFICQHLSRGASGCTGGVCCKDSPLHPPLGCWPMLTRASKEPFVDRGALELDLTHVKWRARPRIDKTLRSVWTRVFPLVSICSCTDPNV